MDNRSTIRYQIAGAKGGRHRKGQPLNGLRCEAGEARKGRGKTLPGDEPVKRPQGRSDWSGGQEKPLSDESKMPVPQTDTGRRVENTKANGKTLVKELGKIAA